MIFYLKNHRIDNAVRRCLSDKTKWFYQTLVLQIRLIFQNEQPQQFFLCCGCFILFYLPGLKESFRLTLRLKTRWPSAQSLESGQK